RHSAGGGRPRGRLRGLHGRGDAGCEHAAAAAAGGNLSQGGAGGMKLILGLDAGSSSTKLMAMTEDGKKFIVPMRMGPMGDHKTFGAALSRFAADNALTEEDFAYVAVTGGRAAEAGDRILDVPVRRINEIEAMAAGALRFSA